LTVAAIRIDASNAVARAPAAGYLARGAEDRRHG
jgi:hypothetical protein